MLRHWPYDAAYRAGVASGKLVGGMPCAWKKECEMSVLRAASFVGAIMSVLIGSLGLANAAEWKTPGRGSVDRAAIMDAMRPVVAQRLNHPIEFVVQDLRVYRDWAFAQVVPQRPGGGRINIANTPMRAEAEDMDGVRTEAFLKRTATGWRVVEFGIGSTDVWWLSFCGQAPKQLLSDYC